VNVHVLLQQCGIDIYNFRGLDFLLLYVEHWPPCVLMCILCMNSRLVMYWSGGRKGSGGG
jgi:hypothetical protein